MADLPDEVKAAIMLEVHSQLGPLKTEVSSLNTRMRSLYSNGSGGPPGFLEMARKEDDQRYGRLFDLVEAHGLQLNKVAGWVGIHTTRDAENEDRQKKKEERFKFWVPWAWKIAAAFVGGVISLGVWGCHTVLPIANVLWQEYLKEHPIAAIELKKVSVNQANPGLSYSQPASEVSTVPKE